MIVADKAILATLAWATENHLTDFVPFGDADEEGNLNHKSKARGLLMSLLGDRQAAMTPLGLRTLL